ncbi:MAG: DUF1801 domain-containing protein [Acidovorax sp.]|nr:MAG: DUF1801 domain-containing protein [Acidovorax sp.]
MSDARVKKLLEDLRALDASRYALVLAVRDKVLGLDPSVTEEVKYGGLLFSAGKAFCGVFAYTKHVSLEFGDGAALPDPHGVLEGNGKLRRHIKLVVLEDLQTRHVPDYLKVAYQHATKA